jgi:hypothetical protein
MLNVASAKSRLLAGQVKYLTITSRHYVHLAANRLKGKFLASEMIVSMLIAFVILKYARHQKRVLRDLAKREDLNKKETSKLHRVSAGL